MYDSAIAPAKAHIFVYGFFLGHAWDVLLWSRSSRITVSFRQVARGGGVLGISWGCGDGYTQWPDNSLVLRLPMTVVHSSRRRFVVVSRGC